MKKLAVVSVSGGMDSTGLLIKLLAEGYNLNVLSFNYGQKHIVELKRLKKNIKYFQEKGFNINWEVLDVSGVMKTFKSALTDKSIEVPEGHYANENMKATVVPNRNAIFSSIIYGKALSIATRENNDVIIAMGVHSGDHEIYPDCRKAFFDVLGEAFKIGNWESEKVSYYLPYLERDKFSILEDARINCKVLGLNFNKIFKNTNTCYKPNEKGESCGKCGSCTERLEAFEKLGAKDPVKYSI
jgi:7-cyano-7-deazaguanine synthase